MIMPSKNSQGDKIRNYEHFVKFKIDKPFRMFVGEIEGGTVKKISTEKLKGFKDGDKVVVMHSEDWLWFFNELLKHQETD